MKFIHLTEALKALLDNWEIRCLVLFSLLLQIVLIFSADHRKRNVSRLLSLVLWLAYLLADAVATFALGVLTHSEDEPSGPEAEKETLLAFWSPFLLLHLGGPDTITAFSLEDNELWRRHLLGLVFQVGTAMYVFGKSLSLSTSLLLPSLFMFATGLLKYGERTWALFSASMDHFRSSLLTPPDPGPNYAKFMEEYASSQTAGLHAQIIVETERRPKSITPEDSQTDQAEKSPEEIVKSAYRFFLTFRRLIVDLILTFQDRINSQTFFLKGLKAEEAFKVVEIELSFIYDVLHTKSAVIHSITGRLIRLTTFISSLIALLLFFLIDKHRYSPTDVSITYTLAIGAVVLEIYAMFYSIVSFWTFNWLSDCNYTKLASLVFQLSNAFGLYEKRSWSDSMASYNLFLFCHKDQRSITMGKITSFLGFKDTWDHFRYTKHKQVHPKLREVIFRELKLKTGSITDSASYKRFSACRGEWALRQKGYYAELGWSVEAEFDESILLWHIATDLCFYQTEYNSTDLAPSDDQSRGKDDAICISRHVSDYLLYLLLQRPFMLTAGIGQIRYGDTCAEVQHFFQRWGEGVKFEDGCKSLLEVNTEYLPIVVKGDRSKSVLFDACRLAKELVKIEDKKTRWELISLVWAEMLCFAATKCRGNFHAKQLSYGGELLTHVWILMAHMGIGEQYRIEAGHARAKLFVDK